MKLLLIEDDIQLNTTIKKFLQMQNFDVKAAFDGQEAIDLIDNTPFDAYIVDINIPRIDGLELVKYIRKKDLSHPIVIITASLEIDNFLKAFDNGCNEYIKKPFHLRELEVRLNNLLQKRQSDILQINDTYAYDFTKEELLINDKAKILRKKLNRLLQILLRNIDHVVPTESIIDYVWENEVRESYPLRQLVTDLRKEFTDGKNHIISIPGIGYKFES